MLRRWYEEFLHLVAKMDDQFLEKRINIKVLREIRKDMRHSALIWNRK
jgi:triphosphoribosyl-dephospho-CoA synthetase